MERTVLEQVLFAKEGSIILGKDGLKGIIRENRLLYTMCNCGIDNKML